MEKWKKKKIFEEIDIKLNKKIVSDFFPFFQIGETFLGTFLGGIKWTN